MYISHQHPASGLTEYNLQQIYHMKHVQSTCYLINAQNQLSDLAAHAMQITMVWPQLTSTDEQLK